MIVSDPPRHELFGAHSRNLFGDQQQISDSKGRVYTLSVRNTFINVHEVVPRLETSASAPNQLSDIHEDDEVIPPRPRSRSCPNVELKACGGKGLLEIETCQLSCCDETTCPRVSPVSSLNCELREARCGENSRTHSTHTEKGCGIAADDGDGWVRCCDRKPRRVFRKAADIELPHGDGLLKLTASFNCGFHTRRLQTCHRCLCDRMFRFPQQRARHRLEGLRFLQRNLRRLQLVSPRAC